LRTGFCGFVRCFFDGLIIFGDFLLWKA
jgi:hypothetical protein